MVPVSIYNFTHAFLNLIEITKASNTSYFSPHTRTYV